MSNRRVKSLDYDDDDYDDYEDEYADGGALSAEDQEQMKLGTIKVREAIGVEYSVSDTEIQDALWNYYYDIAKTVAYLKNKQKPRQAAKSKPPPNKMPPNFFDDCPWGHVPEHRQALIIEHHTYPRGLLGGSSGKMSKLAALAAKRRQKENEPAASVESDDTIAALKKLTIQQKKPVEVETKLPEPAPAPEPEIKEEKVVEEESVIAKADPSSFATTLLASSPPVHLPDDLRLLKNEKAFDFSEPSPDDLIYRAQTGKNRT